MFVLLRQDWVLVVDDDIDDAVVDTCTQKVTREDAYPWASTPCVHAVDPSTWVACRGDDGPKDWGASCSCAWELVRQEWRRAMALVSYHELRVVRQEVFGPSFVCPSKPAPQLSLQVPPHADP